MNTDKVLQVLRASSEPMKSAEIASAAAIDKAEVDKAIKALVKQELVESPKRCYYAARK